MDVTVKKKINPARVIIAAVIVCACLAVLFYIRANTVEDIVASLVEKGSMDNMICQVLFGIFAQHCDDYFVDSVLR